MQPHAVISGRVLDDEGEPIPHVQVHAMTYRYMQGRKQLMPTGNASTNDLGEYRIFGLPPGKYFVSANPPRQPMMDGAVPSSRNRKRAAGYNVFFQGSTEVSSAAPVTISAGSLRATSTFNFGAFRRSVFAAES
jgi:protocatechuate 3,4-dioxygenase beta subunit